MPVTISEHFGLDPRKLRTLGVLDGCLDIDARLFIDPALLSSTHCRELRGARMDILRYFNNIISLLEQSRRKDDALWRAAERLLRFPEVRELGIGYSQGSTAGSGIGPTYTNKLLETASEILSGGIRDPEIFELAPLFEEGIGPDRISDMAGALLQERLAKFTTRVAERLRIPTTIRYKIKGSTYILPRNPYTERAVFFLPMDILDELPVASDRSDIERIVARNAEVRGYLNSQIGGHWKARELTKRQLREAFVRNPSALRELLDRYRRARATPYDFEKDPKSLIRWAWIAEFVKTVPLTLKRERSDAIGDSHRTVRAICEHFAKLVHDNGLNRLLYVGRRPRPERFAQLLFFAIADGYCRANDLDISPESNAGRGPVDFKVSRGAKKKILVEVKLSKNSALIHGYTKQLPTYAAAESSLRSIYLVIDLGRNGPAMARLRGEAARAPDPKPDLIIADARLRRSASKVP